MMTDNCLICEREFRVQWTDTHGIAACIHCGTPYRILHYEGKERVEKEPEPMLNDSGMEIARQYWQERQRRAFPGTFDFGFLSGRTTTYSGATRDDIDVFNEWYQTNHGEAGKP